MKTWIGKTVGQDRVSHAFPQVNGKGISRKKEERGKREKGFTPECTVLPFTVDLKPGRKGGHTTSKGTSKISQLPGKQDRKNKREKKRPR